MLCGVAFTDKMLEGELVWGKNLKGEVGRMVWGTATGQMCCASPFDSSRRVGWARL